jgi:hopanoid C-2 methylase
MPPTPRNRRKVLCVFPAYAPSFGTFEYAWPIKGGVSAFMPPQGILMVASYLPKKWEVRFVDENIRRARASDFTWADVVFISGMHVQRRRILDINRRAHAFGKPTALGGPSVSTSPEAYPDIDYLHIGELGDGTVELIARLDDDVSRPPRQVVFTSVERVPMSDFPIPAYALAEIGRYFLGSVQFSSGCPYRCEFCDIPGLYGRVPRLKSPHQVTAELDAMLARGNLGSVYFVDDNFIGNRKAARELLAHLIEWQKARGYPIEFACEATLNIARQPEILAMMREALFCTIFCGIETPELGALHAMDKDHNANLPILEAVRILNSYGLEVVSGIILGLDTDTPETPARLLEFIEQSQIPMLTINLLQALPRTPLWDRLQAAGRLNSDETRESNVEFLLPYDDILAAWRHCMAEAYRPEAIYQRYAHNVQNTYPNRLKPPASPARASWANIAKGLRIMANLLVRVGLFANYRRTFWQLAGPLLRQGRIEDVIRVGLAAHHCITFSAAAVGGAYNASFYSARDARARKSAPTSAEAAE